LGNTAGHCPLSPFRGLKGLFLPLSPAGPIYAESRGRAREGPSGLTAARDEGLPLRTGNCQSEWKAAAQDGMSPSRARRRLSAEGYPRQKRLGQARRHRLRLSPRASGGSSPGGFTAGVARWAGHWRLCQPYGGAPICPSPRIRAMARSKPIKRQSKKGLRHG
jgi:hypothetical protein